MSKKKSFLGSAENKFKNLCKGQDVMVWNYQLYVLNSDPENCNVVDIHVAFVFKIILF